MDIHASKQSYTKQYLLLLYRMFFLIFIFFYFIVLKWVTKLIRFKKKKTKPSHL